MSGNIDFYFRFGERDARLDYLKGREDGEREIPGTDAATISIHEKRFVNEADSAKGALRRAIRGAADNIESRINRLEVERDTDYKNERANEDQDRKVALDALATRLGPGSSRWQIVMRELDDSNRVFNHHSLRVKREPKVTLYEKLLGIQLYYWFLAVLFAFELPINYASFERLFTLIRVHEILQFLSTTFVALILILFAHVIGKLIKQFAQVWKRPFVVILTLLSVGLLSVGVIYGLYELRDLTIQAAIELAEPDTTDTADRNFNEPAQQNTAAETTTTPTSGQQDFFPSDLLLGSASSTMLLVLNLGVFLVAAIGAFARHDPDPDYERAFFARLKAERGQMRMDSDYNKQRAAQVELFDGRGSVLARWSDRIDSEVRHLKDEMARVRQREADEISIVDNVLEKRVLAYRQGNLDYRQTQPPAYFNHPIESKV